MKNTILKATTLLFFASFIIGFVCFKSGYFEKLDSPFIPIKYNITSSLDTPPPPPTDSMAKKVMMQSSKTFIMVDLPVTESPKTSLPKLDSLPKDFHLMLGSKSATILDSKYLIKTNTDSLSDSIK